MISELDENILNTSKNIFKKNNNIISNLNNLIIKNNLSFDSYFPSLIEKNYKELSFLNWKRINYNSSEKNNQNLVNMNDNSFEFYMNDKIKNEFDLLKNLKKQKGPIFYIYKNYSKNKKNIIFNSKRYNIEKNNSIFINILFKKE